MRTKNAVSSKPSINSEFPKELAYCNVNYIDNDHVLLL